MFVAVMFSFSDEQLTINNVAVVDAGTYVCKASNPSGSVEKTFYVSVACK